MRLQKKNSFINLQFLLKLSSQKPFWDEARLSSLVNKQFVCRAPLTDFCRQGVVGTGNIIGLLILFS